MSLEIKQKRSIRRELYRGANRSGQRALRKPRTPTHADAVMDRRRNCIISRAGLKELPSKFLSLALLLIDHPVFLPVFVQPAKPQVTIVGKYSRHAALRAVVKERHAGDANGSRGFHVAVTDCG
jgi:hypothetical protein